MDDYQRREYGTKTGMMGNDKTMSSKSMDMIKGGGTGGENSGPTGSSRHYPKGTKVNLSPDFNPMRDSKRGATDWIVGGVGS